MSKTYDTFDELSIRGSSREDDEELQEIYSRASRHLEAARDFEEDEEYEKASYELEQLNECINLYDWVLDLKSEE